MGGEDSHSQEKSKVGVSATGVAIVYTLKVVSFTLFRVMVTLFRAGFGYSPGVLNPPYTGNSLEWWLLFISS